MSRGDRSEFLKAFGLAALVFAAIFFLVWSFSLKSDRYQQTATDRSHAYARNAETEIAKRCSIAPKAEQVDCVSEAKNTARANQREEQDLAAQKVTAWWTQIMGGAAIFGAVLSAIGVMLVFTTFRETRKAAQTAADQLVLATKSSAAELRPYLFVDKLELIDRRSEDSEEFDEDGDPVPGMFSGRIVVHLRNFGKVPARKITIYLKEYLGRRYEGRFWNFRFTKIELPICAPNHERRIFGSLYIPPKDRFGFDLGIISKILRLRFTFEDDGGQSFEERASFIVYGDDPEMFYLLTDTRVAELRKRAQEFELDYEWPEEG